MPASLQYFPLAWPFLVAFALILVIVIVLLELQVLSYAYRRLGISPRAVFLILLLSLLGSYINIPIAQLPPEKITSDVAVSFFGVEYMIPHADQGPGTVIAVNVGGALIPAILSLYLIFKHRLFLQSVIAVAVVAAIVHSMAHPVKGVGISVPIFIPPLIAAGVAMILSSRKAPPLAYIAGCMGTLIGADLLNLGRIQGLHAPVASIGGAGTFDGVFLTGIIAVLLPPSRISSKPPPGHAAERRNPPPPESRRGIATFRD